jgi:hypothetical protein
MRRSKKSRPSWRLFHIYFFHRDPLGSWRAVKGGAVRQFILTLDSSPPQFIIVFEDFMQSVNDAPRSLLSHAISVDDLVEQHYLPYVKLHKSASTAHGYEGLWNRYGKESPLAALKEIQVRTVDIRQLLLSVQSERQSAMRTFQHLKSFLSAIFTYALNEGLIKANPVHGTMWPEDAKAPRETYAYKLAEIQQMFNILIGAPKAFVAIAALAGLRLGEIQGLRWEDITKDEILVSRSVWREIADEPKALGSPGTARMRCAAG